MAEYLTLKTSDCKNCYKCIRHCPVKSIKFDHNHVHIILEECILCGHCFVICPQNAKEIRSDVAAAKALLQSGSPVYVSLAPSFTANYNGLTIGSMERALKRLGFAGVEETAIGATIVKRQYDALVNREEQQVIISTCCPTINLLIQKYYPEAIPSTARVVSPMQAHCMDLKRRYPEAKTVFIGPCISKKAESDSFSAGTVDCALTFVELSDWLKSKNIELDETGAGTAEGANENTRARLFPTNGGILRTMAKENPRYTYLAVDGIENCIRSIEDVVQGKLDRCFIEMSACTGSCASGPVMQKNHEHPVRNYIAVNKYAGTGDFPVFEYNDDKLLKELESLALRKVHFGEKAIAEVLQKLGKTKPEHELNCGSCGYNTCREKAQAVLEGKATLTMCLPYLLGKAESFSDDIIKNTPNAIIVLNEDFEVQQINTAACKLLNVAPSNILGDPVVRILDPVPFLEVTQNGVNSYNKRVYLADYEKHVDETIIYDKSYRILMCIMRDVTEETALKEEKEIFNRKAVEITDKVIEKQMRAVQEIASLLGETTAETKVALTKLKESLTDA
ncbi:hydrogenase [Spirochaetia bacterium]|nr:hydrogenase [Spirochaetia bacterium]